jgi:glycerate 2-kinase
MTKVAALREMAETIFRQALADCTVEQAFARAIRTEEGASNQKLFINGVEAIDFNRVKHIRIVAVGKASSTMLGAILPHLRPASDCDVAGVLIARERPMDLPPSFQFFQGSHPLPDEASFAGAQAALAMLNAVPDDPANVEQTLCLFLISGGASAMMELPLDSTIPLAETISFHRELVHSGASIAEINCIRKHFSAVKGGRLAMAARGIASLSLLVSDVPTGHLDALGSGPTLADTSTVEQCREILGRYNLQERFPVSVRRFFDRKDLPETPKPGSLNAKAITVLASDNLAESARMRAEVLGFHAVVDNTCDDWDYRSAARYLIDRLRSLRSEYPRVCLISSGEVTVEVPSIGVEDSDGRHIIGVGGRNQHLSLYAATLLEPSDASTIVLSAGSDGIDGNSLAAGAVVDEQSLWPSAAAEVRAAAQNALERFDSSTFLERIGSTVTTGPTGNNLRDLRILLAERPS